MPPASDGVEPLARRLARAAVAIGARPLPADALARTQALLRDFLGVALGGAPAESTVAVRRALDALGLRGPATVLGVAGGLTAPHAALANGAAAHALEMDDTHQGGSIHLGASVFPAALAAAELADAGGARVLCAAVAGYEVGARLAEALDPAAHYARGFHPTGTCGTFAAAVAAGIVLGLDEDALTAALGVAGSQAAGSMEFLADGAWTKRLHPGWAACAGLHAAALGAAGFHAPATILEGRFGVLQAWSGAARTEPLTAPQALAVLRTSVKPHACCRYMQGPIDGVLALRAAHGLAAAQVERIEVGMLAAAMPIVCEPAAAKCRPASVVDAQFSLPFGIAVALARGSASADDFVPANLRDPEIGALMERVGAVRDPALDAVYPRQWPSWVRVHTRDGRTLETRVDHPLGDPEHFPDDAALDAKFRRLAARSLTPEAIARVERELAVFADSSRAATLLAASVPAGR